MKCKGCGGSNGVMNNTLIICNECLNPSSWKVMSKTIIMEKYALNKKDLIGVQYATGWIAGSNISRHLYLIDDVEAVAIRKYGSRQNVMKRLSKRKNKREYKIKRKNEIEHMRKITLHKYLINLGLDGFKDDNDLCLNYVKTGEPSKEKIATELIEMDFFHKKTIYESALKSNRKLGVYQSEQELIDSAKDMGIAQYAKDNFLNTHKMIDEVPLSLKDRISHFVEYYYEKYNTTGIYISRSKRISDYTQQILKEKNAHKKTNNDFQEIARQIRKSLME